MAEGVPPYQLQAAEASTFLDHMCSLDINSKASFVRQSGIICTIGEEYLRNFLNKFLQYFMFRTGLSRSCCFGKNDGNWHEHC